LELGKEDKIGRRGDFKWNFSIGYGESRRPLEFYSDSGSTSKSGTRCATTFEEESVTTGAIGQEIADASGTGTIGQGA